MSGCAVGSFGRHIVTDGNGIFRLRLGGIPDGNTTLLPCLRTGSLIFITTDGDRVHAGRFRIRPDGNRIARIGTSGHGISDGNRAQTRCLGTVAESRGVHDGRIATCSGNGIQTQRRGAQPVRFTLIAQSNGRFTLCFSASICFATSTDSDRFFAAGFRIGTDGNGIRFRGRRAGLHCLIPADSDGIQTRRRRIRTDSHGVICGVGRSRITESDGTLRLRFGIVTHGNGFFAAGFSLIVPCGAVTDRDGVVRIRFRIATHCQSGRILTPLRRHIRTDGNRIIRLRFRIRPQCNRILPGSRSTGSIGKTHHSDSGSASANRDGIGTGRRCIPADCDGVTRAFASGHGISDGN